MPLHRPQVPWSNNRISRTFCHPRLLMLALICAVGCLRAQGVQVFQLRNGMQVAYVQDTSRRLLHIGLTLRGGAALNPQGGAGLSHFFEHHFFGGIDSAAGAPGGRLQGIGMMSTAATYLEHQTFTMSMEPARMHDGLSALTMSLRTALDRLPLQERILTDIAGELQAAESSPSHFLLEGLRERLWQSSAAKQVAGQFAALRRIDLDALAAALRPYLHPGNCLLSATGPDPAATFFAEADSLLGDWRPESAGAGIPNAPKSGLRESSYFVLENEYVSRPLMVLAWPVPGARESAEDVRNAHAFAALARTRAGIFQRELTAAGLADALWWEFEGGLNPGHIVLRLTPNPDSIPQCLSAIQTLLVEVGTNAKALAGGEAVAAAEKMAALESAMGWDRSATRLDMLGRRWAGMDPAWANVLPLPMPPAEALRDFAQRYLVGKPHVAGLLVDARTALIAEQDFQVGNAVAAVKQPGKPVAAVQPAPKDTGASQPEKPDALGLALAKLRPLRVFFMPNSLEPDPASVQSIAQAAELLQQFPDIKLYVNGYADGQGDGVTNYKLSIQRALSVQQMLAKAYGIAEERLILNPFGEAFPEYPDDTPEHRAKNRRVTFELAPKDAQPRHFLF